MLVVPSHISPPSARNKNFLKFEWKVTNLCVARRLADIIRKSADKKLLQGKDPVGTEAILNKIIPMLVVPADLRRLSILKQFR